MSEAGEKQTAEAAPGAGSWWTRHLPLEHETAMFVLVSSLDLIMTWILLYRSSDLALASPDSFRFQFVESNPVANFFLMRWGSRGLIVFKFAVVLFVCILAQIIATRNHAKARFVLRLGTLVICFVVVYSLTLYLRHHPHFFG